MSEQFFEAYDKTWVPLANSQALLDLVVRLEPTGIFDDLRTGTTTEAFGAHADLDQATAAGVLDALELFGVVVRDGQNVSLSAEWMALTGPAAFQSLAAMVAGQGALSSILRGLGRRTYWDLSTDERLAMARAASPDPYSDGFVEAYRASLEADRVGRSILQGGRFLELGCGVAGRILLTLRAAPAVTAVGVELSEDLAAEAERRAAELGLSDRFTVICADARNYVADEPFDSGFWSQFFFPEEARAGALAVMMSSLKPGASFQAPVGADPDAVDRDVEAARENAVWHAMLRSWGVPERTVDGLSAELQAAGFVDVEVVKREAGPAVRGWKPTSAEELRPPG